jgi:hypothetical protein
MIEIFIFYRVEAKVLEECGVTEDDFKDAIVKYQNETKLQEVFYFMQVCDIMYYLIFKLESYLHPCYS